MLYLQVNTDLAQGRVIMRLNSQGSSSASFMHLLFYTKDKVRVLVKFCT